MDPWHIASGAVCVVAAVVLSVIVLHPGIREGLIVKAGLIAMILSLCATAALTITESSHWPAYWRAAFTLRAGLAVACLGILIKAHRIGRASRQGRGFCHDAATRLWIYRITEPVRDMAHLFRDERGYDRERRP